MMGPAASRQPTSPRGPQIIGAKITPPQVPATVVPRPRIETQLAELIQHQRIVFLCATAGAGKTTAARQAAARLGLPLCWLAVDTTDAAPGKLLTYLEAALSTTLPNVCGVVDGALRAQLPHTEIAGLLADALGAAPVLLVLDDLERIADSAEAVAVLGAFLRYTPPTCHTMLISRCELPFAAQRVDPAPWLFSIGDTELAFTVDEAAAALSHADRGDVDPAEAVAVTGGWVTGVLFEAWRSAGHTSGLGGAADPLHGYLAAHILGQLPEAEVDFLVRTALFHEITPAAAEAVGIPQAAALLHALRDRHLPASWASDGSTLRCHPRFREYLLTCLDRRAEGERKQLHLRYARWLVKRQYLEEAVEEFLIADALDEALPVAERALDAVIERADLAVADRWLRELEPVRRDHHTGLAGAELMLAIAQENYRRGVTVADRLAAAGRRDALARSSSKLASMMAWCYLHAGRVDDIRAVLAIGRPGSELEAMRYCMTLLEDTEAGGQPNGVLSGGPLDALVMRVHYYHGRLSLLLEPPVSPWAAQAAASWRLGALLGMGHVEQAAEGYHAVCQAQDPGAWLSSLFYVELLRELGERDTAWRALLKGRERLRAAGSVMLEMLSYVEEAALDLRLNHDTSSARAALQRVRTHPVGRGYAYIAEQAATWLGFALLLDNEERAAVRCLRQAVASMRSGGRILLLPAAAIYLAEAEWRLGEADNADRAADAAMAAAEQQGSNHLLLEALADFPVVLSRRLDAESGADTPWHELGRALMARGVQLSTPLAGALHLAEFGQVSITLNDQPVRPRIKKSYELLAYLSGRDRPQATKTELLDALFDGRQDPSTTAYLRQALRQLRQVLPESAIDTKPGEVRLGEHISLTSDAGRFRCLLARAAQLRGTDRLTALQDALSIVDGGPYLPGVTSPWAEQRREQLAVQARDARCQAAELAFAAGDYQLATALADTVLADDPYRETLWRLRMRIADATGDPDQVITAYRACEQALAQLDTTPTATTQRLLDNLRR